MGVKVKIIVKGIIFDEQRKRILLLKRSEAESTGAGTWENAGGSVEEGEGLEEALCREVSEEVGLSVAVGDLAYVSYVGSMIVLVYYCTIKSGSVTLSEEHCEARWVGKQQCMKLLAGGIAEDFRKNDVYDKLADC